MDNGNGKFKIAFIVVTAIILPSVATLSGYVIANEDKRVKDATDMRKEIIVGDEKVELKLVRTIEKVEIKLEEIQREQKQIIKDSFERSYEILNALNEIKEKVE